MVQKYQSIVKKKFLSTRISHLPVWPLPTIDNHCHLSLGYHKKYIIFPPEKPIAYYPLYTDLLVFIYYITQVFTY